MKSSFTYYVYILSNAEKTIYTGVTNDLFRRLWQHRTGRGSKFTKKHQLAKLVWFDETDDVTVAIAHEKQIKNWRREWKIDLVETGNPEWLDLADGWYGVEGGF
jgi:putative endonuclease